MRSKSYFFRDEQVESVALILLGKEQELGMLAFRSKDPAHFDPDMDYLLSHSITGSVKRNFAPA